MRVSLTARRAALWALPSGLLAGLAVAAASAIGLGAMTEVVPVAIVVGAVVGAAKLSRDTLRRAVSRTAKPIERSSRQFEERWPEINARLAEIAAIAEFSSVDVPYPLPLGGWAISWDAAILLAREIAIGRPEAVVELGPGASSLIIGLQLRRLGTGHLFSLEHEPEHADLTRRHVRATGLEPWVSILDAPLVDCVIGNEHFQWYDIPQEVGALERIDVLVVDGPPQRVDYAGMPRYPALPVFADKLGPGALVFVDDASRDAEKHMLKRWATEQPQFVTKTIGTKRGTALMRLPRGTLEHD